jgi:hypothetical protein
MMENGVGYISGNHAQDLGMLSKVSNQMSWSNGTRLSGYIKNLFDHLKDIKSDVKDYNYEGLTKIYIWKFLKLIETKTSPSFFKATLRDAKLDWEEYEETSKFMSMSIQIFELKSMAKTCLEFLHSKKNRKSLLNEPKVDASIYSNYQSKINHVYSQLEEAYPKLLNRYFGAPGLLSDLSNIDYFFQECHEIFSQFKILVANIL